MTPCPSCGAENPSFAWKCARCGVALERRGDLDTQRDNLVKDIALGVFVGMVAFSMFAGIVWVVVMLVVG